MNTDIPSLGECRIPSPLLQVLDGRGEEGIRYRNGSQRILVDDRADRMLRQGITLEQAPCFELAGPRRRIHFDPARTTIGIVTCGGLCPGINNVIRDLVMAARHHYGVQRIVGFRYGYRGLVSDEPPVELDTEAVSEIHARGGSILATSRGSQRVDEMVDGLLRHGVDVLFVIGGDGTMRGATALAGEIRRRGVHTGIIGVPKTIDNDFQFMDQSFGYHTAASKAVEALNGAHREAQGAPNGIGVVKLMGRHSGFIACVATLASNHPNYVLIPEVPFALDGPTGFLEHLHARVLRRKHALIVVAEGAGQEHVRAAEPQRDASGNMKLADIGPFLCNRIKSFFVSRDTEANLKYIDPSYIIRSIPADAHDSALCTNLALNAVHAAMAGKTEMVIAVWHRHLVHVPIHAVISERNTVDPYGALWLGVLGSTGQPPVFG